MRYWSQTNRQSGFTLIEMLIIAPIVILAIGGFIAVMMTMVGEAIVTREESALTFNTQQALDRIEQDVRLSTQFLVTSGDMPSPQGSNDSTAAFSNASNALLLSAVATTKNPSDISRELVYIDNQPNQCSGDRQYNRALLTKVIYYVKNGSLWRRTILPDWTTTANQPTTVCAAPWQQNTCTPGYSAARCQTNDERILDNITALNVSYYSAPGDTTALPASNATSAAAINASITVQKTVAGGNVASNTANVRVSKLNDIDTTQLPPAAPDVSHTTASPNSIEFTWQPVPTATAYQVKYKINSGQEITQTVDAATTSLTINGNRLDTITFKVASFNGAGSSAYSTATASIPPWFDLTFATPTAEIKWENHSSDYNTAAFTKTSAGRVFLKGVIKNTGSASTVSIKTIGYLPEGYRPQSRLVFQTLTSSDVAGRIDIKPDGEVIAYSGNSGWIALDNVSFLPDGHGYSWTPANYQNGWSNWSSEYESVHATKDSLGRVNMQGLARAGTNTSNTTIFTQTSSFWPAKSLHFPAGGSGFAFSWVWSDGDVVKRGAQTSSYQGLQFLYYPGSTGSWTPIPYNTANISPAWVAYNTSPGSYPQLECVKASDGVVTIRGLIKNGETTSGKVIANLPAACPPPTERQWLMVVVSADDIGRVNITSGGQIVIRKGSSSWMALNLSYLSDE